ncbi:hypothetical protein E8E12_006883 [Didymella heteroderae]|uniref:Uncharacterized protein n=1 Tax=Didymella heteroderae TaxID=1769908 RepID=A0A9P5C190_9PLEO|nr:hypothetical protein E8E12_006883 [Didymella heteroderae]
MSWDQPSLTNSFHGVNLNPPDKGRQTKNSNINLDNIPTFALVNAYKEYVHGNPYKERKVVLDQALLDDGLGADVVVVPRDQLKQQFCQLLRRETDMVRKNGQKLLVMTMGHGKEETYAVNLGEFHNQTDWFTVQDFKDAVIPQPDLQAGATKTDLKITYLTTACFSGG